jgi:hypothetical protein
MDVTYHKLGQFVQDVIVWNKVIGEDFGEHKFDLQKKITLEEINETIEAYRNNDKKEIIDGVGDILVTAGYFNYLKTQSDEFLKEKIQFDSEVMPFYIGFESLLDNIKTSIIRGHTCHFSLSLLASKTIDMYGRELVEDYFQAIIKSNYSKFILPEDWNEDLELQHARNKYAGKFENIIPVTVTVDNQDYILLKADNGKGKLLKPTLFREPHDFMINPI